MTSADVVPSLRRWGKMATAGKALLAPFTDYPARPEPSDGWGGKRVASADEILFLPVPDVAVRLASVETGEYHFAQNVKQDQYERDGGLPGLAANLAKPSGWITAVPNPTRGRS